MDLSKHERKIYIGCGILSTLSLAILLLISSGHQYGILLDYSLCLLHKPILAMVYCRLWGRSECSWNVLLNLFSDEWWISTAFIDVKYGKQESAGGGVKDEGVSK